MGKEPSPRLFSLTIANNNSPSVFSSLFFSLGEYLFSVIRAIVGEIPFASRNAASENPPHDNPYVCLQLNIIRESYFLFRCVETVSARY